MISKIEKKGLCLGCGLCSSIFPDKCTMYLGEDGFYHPQQKIPFTRNERNCVKKLCPSIHIEGIPSKGIWGKTKFIAEAWSTDKRVRFKAASGGATTSLALYLLESKKVDAVLQVGVSDKNAILNELKISKKRDDIIRNAQSRYAPVPLFKTIISILDSSNDIFAFIGKPCDIAAVQNLCRLYPQYINRFKYFLSIFCAGMPSYNATRKAYQMSGRSDEPIFLQYRGNGWPGFFHACWLDGNDFKMSYNESWGKILGKQICPRCKICPDGIGMLADIAIGDCWNTPNGYPDFTEEDGKCFCIIRTENGAHLFNDAVQKGYIEGNEIALNNIRYMQPYQFERRKMIGWRLVPIQLLTGFMLSFRGLSIFSLTMHANFVKGLRNMIGSFKRFYMR